MQMTRYFEAADPGSLPTYEAATSHNPIVIIAPYIRREDLFNCALVSWTWNHAISSELWGEPAECFGFGEKSHLASFLLFLKALPHTSPVTLSQTHTLNLEKCIASIYTSLPDTWFPNLLVLLPDLRRLLLPGITFVDHASLLQKPSIKGYLPHHNLYHLNISNLTNTTPTSLIKLFINLTPGLGVLDLSRTTSASHPDVLSAVGSLRNLRSLKLRWLKLSDRSMELLARRLQVKIERLDVTGNLLTDGLARYLLDWCFMPPEFEVAMDDTGSNIRVPVAHESDDESDTEFGDEEEWMTARKLQRRESRTLETSLPDVEGNLPPVGDKGLTHLHISNNKMSSLGVNQVLNSTRLKTLDCGTITQRPNIPRRKEIKDITTAITYYGFRKLRSLRIHRDAILLTRSSGCKDTDLLDISRVPHLKTLALTDVPATADATTLGSLINFLTKLSETNLKMLVLEMEEPKSEEMGFYDITAPVADMDTQIFFEMSKDDFSFFEDERSIPGGMANENERLTSARKEVQREVEVGTLDIIKEWRNKSRQGERRWQGNIRVLRDIGGVEALERGAEGNRWGIMVSDFGR
ncbi:hypothetical protein TWF225_005616 [Orbilia oligospora]|nr:hypothetical protein TWF225_005616 [Orbilia oligospora]KAF3238553.1 hypothetical protein TWF128_012021 [Orbilia oligospora]KAF3275452.1 hypothetical protein TWF132_002905 [Orbilia oligospora]